jgi:hypothetical protein
MVEESTAASHTLAQETEELTDLVNRFQLSEETRRSAATRPGERMAA